MTAPATVRPGSSSSAERIDPVALCSAEQATADWDNNTAAWRAAAQNSRALHCASYRAIVTRPVAGAQAYNRRCDACFDHAVVVSSIGRHSHTIAGALIAPTTCLQRGTPCWKSGVRRRWYAYKFTDRQLQNSHFK